MNNQRIQKITGEPAPIPRAEFKVGKYYRGLLRPIYVGNDKPHEIQVVSVSKNGWVGFRRVNRDKDGNIESSPFSSMFVYHARAVRRGGLMTISARTSYSVQDYFSFGSHNEPMTRDEYNQQICLIAYREARGK